MLLLYFITVYRVSGNSIIKYRIGTLTSKCRRSGTCCYILGIIRYLIGTLTPNVMGPGTLYHLVGIKRYLLGLLTSNLRFRSQGWGGGRRLRKSFKHMIGYRRKKFPPSWQDPAIAILINTTCNPHAHAFASSPSSPVSHLATSDYPDLSRSTPWSYVLHIVRLVL